MKRVILGVDPGFVIAGYAIISIDQGKTELLECGLLAMKTKDADSSTAQHRLHCCYNFFTEKITRYQVTEIALETPFFGKNAQNFLKLGYVRGILLLLSAQHNCHVREFAPRQVKMAITGFGGAEKDQVMRVIMRLFPRLPIQPRYDVTDAIAVALCCSWTTAEPVR